MAKTLFNILLLLFAFLMVQDNLPFIISGDLKGAFSQKKDIEFTWKKWWTGEYQTQKDAYINEKFPFRNDVVRLNNQLDYSLFKQTNAASIVLGKDGYLYESPYIDSYLGLDFVGQKTVDKSVNAIKLLQDSLTANGKLMLTIIAPGKGYFYPEYFPSSYPAPKDSTNYKSFLSAVNNLDEPLNLIDFNAWILSQKDTSRYSLYPKTGIHWSMYASALAIDTLSNYIESKTGEDMPDIEWEEMNITPCQYGDCDVEQALNLIFPIKNQLLAYPKLKFIQEGKKMFKVIIVSDSFYFAIFHHHTTRQLFGNTSEFWYYYNSIIPPREKDVLARNLELRKEIDSADIVIIMQRETIINEIGSGFVEAANAMYAKQK